MQRMDNFEVFNGCFCKFYQLCFFCWVESSEALTTYHVLSHSTNVPRFTAFPASLPGRCSYCNAGPSCRPGWRGTLCSGFWQLRHVLRSTTRCIFLKRCFADATSFLRHLENVYTLFRLLGSLTLQLRLVFPMPSSTTTLIPPGPPASPCSCLRSCHVCVFAPAVPSAGKAARTHRYQNPPYHSRPVQILSAHSRRKRASLPRWHCYWKKFHESQSHFSSRAATYLSKWGAGDAFENAACMLQHIYLKILFLLFLNT